MQPIENPFTDADRLLDEASEPLPPIRLVDFHCELTSEKNALGLYLDGRVSVVVGTHTHVVTGDERILPNGTAYQTDLGHDRADLERHRVRPEDRPAAVHQRAADAVRGRQRDRSSSTPCRSTSTRRRDVRSPSSGSSASSRPDVTRRAGVGRARRRARRRRVEPVVPPAPSTGRPPHPHDPLRRRPRAGRAGSCRGREPASGCSR